MLLQVLITIGASQALTLAILILLKKQPSQADYLLSIKLFLVFVITLLYNYHDTLEVVAPAFTLTPFLLGYLVLPIFYFYIKSASGRKVDFSKRENFIHFLPFIAANLVLIYYFYPLPYDTKQAFFCCMEPQPTWFSALRYLLFFGVFPYYNYKSYLFLKRHENCILTRFSYTEDISLEWLVRFLWGMVFVGATFITFEVIMGNFLAWDSKETMMLPFIVLLCLIFYLGIYGLRHKIIFFDPEPALEPSVASLETESKYQYSNLTEEKAEGHLEQLMHYMNTEKPHLQPKITIGELSQKTNIPVNHLSQIINEKLNQNFFDFINGYRVAEFKSLLAQPNNQNYTLLSLAFEAGFNSKSSFNAIFKKITGQTPSDYARQNTISGNKLSTASESK